MVRLGGWKGGEVRLGAPKLTGGQAREMRVLRSLGLYSIAALAELYGVSKAAAGCVVHGESFPDAGGPIERVGSAEYWTKRRHPEHGSPSMYAAGCRCDKCGEANRVRCREWRVQRGRGAGRGVHGDV
jgi:hypothetical protein